MRISYLAAIGLAAFGLVLLRPGAASHAAELRDACLHGSNMESCDRVGDLLERGELSPGYPEEAGHYFAFACEGGLARSCPRAQSWGARYSDYEAYETDVGCMLQNNAFACEEVGNTLREEQEEGNTQSDLLPLARSRMKRALSLYLDACAKADAASCYGASRVFDGGFGVAYDPLEARAKGTQACALGLPAACEAEGDAHEGRPVAIGLYERACNLPQGSPHACLKLARALESGRSQPDVVATSYRNACERLAFDACSWVSGTVERLDGESPAVVQAFRRWCDSGDARACKLVKALPAPR